MQAIHLCNGKGGIQGPPPPPTEKEASLVGGHFLWEFPANFNLWKGVSYFFFISKLWLLFFLGDLKLVKGNYINCLLCIHCCWYTFIFAWWCFILFVCSGIPCLLWRPLPAVTGEGWSYQTTCCCLAYGREGGHVELAKQPLHCQPRGGFLQAALRLGCFLPPLNGCSWA